MNWVGRSIRRFEDRPLLLGRGRYTADIARGAAAVRFVRSPVARGRIISVKAPDGVRVYTAADLVGVKPIRPLLHRPEYVAIGQPALADGRVNHVGEAIAVVVASDPAQAEDMADLVELEIEEEPAAVDLDAALEPSAPIVHAEAPANVIVEAARRTPGLEAAFARAAKVIEIDVRAHRQSAMPIETRGGLAAWDRATGRVTLTCAAQMAHMLRTGIADCLGIAESDLRVIAPDVGGGFGQKLPLFPEYIVLVWLARELRRPLAWIEDRQENFLAATHARDQRCRVRAAFDADARLLALDADVRCNVGAYSSYPFTAGIEPLQAFAELPGPYDFQEYGVRSRGVLTNTCMMAPYRGVSRPVLTFTMERLMDTAASRFGIDPVEIRRRNLIRTFPYKSVTGLLYDEGSYLQTLELAARTIDVAAFRERQKKARAEGKYLGLGFSSFSERTGYGSPAFGGRSMEIVPGFETVEVAMDPSGFVEVRIGSSPHGQGLKTALAQIIADELGIDPAAIRIFHGDTDSTPYGWGTFAARSLVICGGACKLAAQGLAAKIVAVAAVMMEVSAADVELVDGRARVKGSDAAIEIAAVARTAYHQAHKIGPELAPGLRESASYDPAGTFCNACHVAIVEVDIETGGVKFERFLVVEDAGVLINPMIVDGQIHGGVVQGIANALYEEIKYDPSGNLLTATFADYLAPTVSEVPAIETMHVETAVDPSVSVTRAKGVGEGGPIGAPAAVVNAIVDALSPFGIELFEIPVTPRRIREKLRECLRQQDGRRAI